MPVFVYGGLMYGFDLHAPLANCFFLGRGTVKGRLFDLGRYPGLVPGSEEVWGEVYEVDAPLTETLDGIEGYDPVRDEGPYLRRPVQVRFGDEAIEAHAYFYNGPLGEAVVVAGGDFVRSRGRGGAVWVWRDGVMRREAWLAVAGSPRRFARGEVEGRPCYGVRLG